MCKCWATNCDTFPHKGQFVKIWFSSYETSGQCPAEHICLFSWLHHNSTLANTSWAYTWQAQSITTDCRTLRPCGPSSTVYKAQFASYQQCSNEPLQHHNSPNHHHLKSSMSMQTTISLKISNLMGSCQFWHVVNTRPTKRKSAQMMDYLQTYNKQADGHGSIFLLKATGMEWHAISVVTYFSSKAIIWPGKAFT